MTVPIDKLLNGLSILRRYIESVEIDPIPETYPGGAEKRSYMCYINAEVGMLPITASDKEELDANGWMSECEGDFWVFYPDRQRG